MKRTKHGYVVLGPWESHHHEEPDQGVWADFVAFERWFSVNGGDELTALFDAEGYDVRTQLYAFASKLYRPTVWERIQLIPIRIASWWRDFQFQRGMKRLRKTNAA